MPHGMNLNGSQSFVSWLILAILRLDEVARFEHLRHQALRLRPSLKLALAGVDLACQFSDLLVLLLEGLELLPLLFLPVFDLLSGATALAAYFQEMAS